MKISKVSFLGLLLSLGLMITTCKTVDVKPDKSDQITKDPVPKKTCREFNEYVKNIGVTVKVDGREQSRPGKGGTTGHVEEYEAKRDPTYRSTETVRKIKCGCTGKLYDDATTCTKECKASLGCFTGICGPSGETKQVCLTTTVHIAFSSSTPFYRVDWQPTVSVSNACRAEITQWNQRIEMHEQRHVQIARDMVNSYNDKWKNGKTFKACGNTEAEAEQKLKEQIDDFKTNVLNKELEQMKADRKQKDDDFEKSSEGAPVKPLDCNVCP
jgi:hypothetical protein